MEQGKELKSDAVEVRYSRYETAINQHDQLKHELFNLWNDIVKNPLDWYDVYTELSYCAEYTPMDYPDFIRAFERHNPTESYTPEESIIDFINVCIRF